MTLVFPVLTAAVVAAAVIMAVAVAVHQEALITVVMVLGEEEAPRS